MTVITTSLTDVQERLSLAYLTAVAAKAGCQVLETKVDRNGIDATIRPISGAIVQIDVQMKSVSQDIRISGGEFLSFQLDRATYDKLRRQDNIAPQLLVVFEMPRDASNWLCLNENPHMQTILQHAAYWTDLRGSNEISADSKAVHISTKDVFDHTAIQAILTRAHERAQQGLAWG